MTEKPILFSGPMSAAIRAGRKSQTRRPIRGIALALLQSGELTSEQAARPENRLSPYGYAGGRLWGKETFFAFGHWETRFSERRGRDEWHFNDMTVESGQEYRFDLSVSKAHRTCMTPAWWRRPAIFMPRVASRLTREVVAVRIERLHDITEADAVAEGIELLNGRYTYNGGRREDRTARESYAALWDELNADRGLGWDSNPFVWAVEFPLSAPQAADATGPGELSATSIGHRTEQGGNRLKAAGSPHVGLGQPRGE